MSGFKSLYRYWFPLFNYQNSSHSFLWLYLNNLTNPHPKVWFGLTTNTTLDLTNLITTHPIHFPSLSRRTCLQYPINRRLWPPTVRRWMHPALPLLFFTHRGEVFLGASAKEEIESTWLLLWRPITHLSSKARICGISAEASHSPSPHVEPERLSRRYCYSLLVYLTLQKVSYGGAQLNSRPSCCWDGPHNLI